jgi:hypothetical protein
MNTTNGYNAPQQDIAVSEMPYLMPAGLRIEPPRNLINPIPTRGISIQTLHRGYIVNVGCHSFAFETKETMLEKLTEYINNPQEAEQKWNDGSLF